MTVRTPSHPIALLSARAAFAGLLVSAACEDGCALLPEPEVPPDPPPPAWVVTRPLPDVRDWHDVVMLAAGLGFVVGTDGQVGRLGATGALTLEDTGVTADLEGVSAALDAEGDPVVIACGADGTVIVLRGGTWTTLATVDTTYLFSCWLRNDQDGFVVGDRGTIYRYRFDGTAQTLTLMDQQSLQPVPITDPQGNPATGFFPISDSLKGVAGGGGNVWAVGSGGSVYRFNMDADPADLTNTWVEEDSTTQRPLVSLFSRAGLWAPTTDGVVARSDGAGAWDDEFTGPVPVFLQDVFVGNGIYLVGLVDRLYHRRDDGIWEEVVLEEEVFLRGIDAVELPPLEEGDPPGLRVVAVGAGGRIVEGPAVVPNADLTALELREIPPAE